MKKLLLTSILFLGIVSYSQQHIYSYYFSEAQPTAATSINSFSKDIQGTYVKKDDEVVDIIIDSTKIEFRYIVKMLLTTNEIKENTKYYFKNNRLFGVDSTKGLEYFIENDTVYFGVYQKEVFFELNENSHIKKYKNQYVLSEKKAEGIWDVRVVYKKDTNLYIRSIDIVEEEEKVNALLPKPAIKRYMGEKVFVSSPSKSQFTIFIDKKGFYDILYYTVKQDE